MSGRPIGAEFETTSHELQAVNEELRSLLGRLAELTSRFGSGARVSGPAR